MSGCGSICFDFDLKRNQSLDIFKVLKLLRTYCIQNEIKIKIIHILNLYTVVK